MLHHHLLKFLALAILLAAPAAMADEPPPPPAPAGPTTFVVEQRSLGEPTTRMASPVMFGIGAALGGLGLISFGTGYFVYKDAPDCNDCPGSEKQGLGTGFMVGGIAGLVVGLPLAIIGARQVPDTPAWARAMPMVFVSPRGGALRWTF
jgi:hypothetical protein